MAEPARYYTITTLAERWGVSPRTVRKLIKSGELPHIRIGALIRIRPDQAEAYEKQGEENECPDPETQLANLDYAREAKFTKSISQATEALKAFQRERQIAQVLNLRSQSS